jgi:hypothetical protein
MPAFTRVGLNTTPGLHTGVSGSFSMTTFAIDASTDQVEWVFRCPEAITITELLVPYGARTGTPTLQQISLQGVSAGIPDGSIKSAGNAKLSFTPPASTAWDNTSQWQTLTSSYAAAAGELLSIVISYVSGTVNASNQSTYRLDADSFTSRMGFPYAIRNNAGVRTRSGQMPVYGFRSSTTTYGQPWSGFAATGYSSNSSPNERALRFMLPAGISSYYQVTGGRYHGTSSAAAKTFRLDLYEGTTVRNTTGSLDSDDLRVNATGDLSIEFYWNDTPWILQPAVEYYVSLIPEDTSNSLALLCAAALNAQDAAVNGDGAFYLATRAGGAWTADTTQRPLMELYLYALGGPLFIPVE